GRDRHRAGRVGRGARPRLRAVLHHPRRRHRAGAGPVPRGRAAARRRRDPRPAARTRRDVPAHAPRDRRRGTDMSKHAGTILVADDDPATRSNLALLLRSEGYRVVEAADGDAAAESLADPSVAAALLDLKMPKRDGLAVLRAHADRLEEVPVVVVTAYG